ncbi:MAG: universal stress protein [Leptolyngbyaceae cyanobacterium]
MPLFSSENVLVPMDFSNEAIQTLKDTLDFVEAPEKLHVVNVLAPLEATEPGAIWQTVDDDTRIKKVTELFYQRFPEEAYQSVKFTVAIGNPSSEIIDYAEQNSIDLIVISSSGKTGISRFFLGSVAERVARFAHCPVLVMRQ